MKASRLIGIVIVLLALVAYGPPVLADREFSITCEGTESGGGGVNRYQYTLRNDSATAITLTHFAVGTQDSLPTNYTFVPTPGFTPAIVPNAGVPPLNILPTSQTKTPHGVVPPVPVANSAMLILWTGSAVIPPGGTITFAFDHPWASWDHQWMAGDAPASRWTAALSNQPIAGPSGVFTRGYVHAPGVHEPIPTLSTWGILVFALALLVGLSIWIRRRRLAASIA